MKALLILGLCAFGFVIGWALKPTTSPESSPSPTRAKSNLTTPQKKRRQDGISVYSKAQDSVQSRLLELAALPTARERYRAAYATVSALPEDELKIWINGNYNEMDGDLNAFLFHALTERLIRQDPQWLVELSFNKSYPHETRRSLLNAWAHHDPEGALAYLGESSYWSRQGYALKAILNTVAQKQPDQALSQLDHLISSSQVDGQDFTETFQILAKNDSASLLQSLENWPRIFQDSALEAITVTELTKDFRTGIAWAQEHGIQRGYLFWELFQNHPETANEYLENYQELPPQWKSGTHFSNAIRSLANRDLPQALEFLSSNNALSSRDRLRTYSQLAKRHGSQIIESILKDPTIAEQARDAILKKSYLQLASSNPEDAATFLDAISTKELRAQAIADREQAETDSKAPPLWTLPPERLLSEAAPTQLNRHLAVHLQSIPADKLNLLVASYENLNQERKEQVSSFIKDHHHRYRIPFELQAARVEGISQGVGDGPNPQQNWQMRELARRWASHSPQEAADWFQSLPAERQSNEVAQAIHRQWQELNTAEADAWAQKHLPDLDESN